jgi:hypothetical protein
MGLLQGRKEVEEEEEEEEEEGFRCLRWRLAWGPCSSRREEEGEDGEEDEEGRQQLGMGRRRWD